MFSRRNSAEKGLRDEIVALRVRLQVSESLAEQLRKENAALKEENARLLAEISSKDAELAQTRGKRDHYCERMVQLQEELRWYQVLRFGSSAHKTTDHATQSCDQLLLFTDPEGLAVVEAARKRTTTVAAHVRKHTGGGRLIPEHFHRNIIPHELEEHERMCYDCDVPHPMTDIGVDVRECYHITPPKITVDRHERHKYACRRSDGGVVTAPAPPVILPKTMASPSLLSFLVTKRTEFSSPIYRTCRELKQWGLDLPTATACRWMNQVGMTAAPVVDMMGNSLFEAPLMQMDETTLQVLKSKDKAATTDHFMVVRAGGTPDKRVIIYSYIPSRTRQALKELLIGPDGRPYQGKLLSDGLERYDEICAQLHLLHFGCWQHARQYYVKAAKVSDVPGARSLAQIAVEDYISKIFKVEARIEKQREALALNGQLLLAQQVQEIRQQESKPLVEGFKEWVDKLVASTPPQSALGKALAYTTSQWPKLARFLDHGDVPIHNNLPEQQNKHFAVGRKNWLFHQHEIGAKASANLYSLTLTCRLHDVVPSEYFEYLFEHLPAARVVAEIEALLPWNVKPVLERRKKEEQEAARKKAEEEAARIKAQQSVRRRAA